MKRILLGIIIILSIFMVFSCGNTSESGEREPVDLDNIQENVSYEAEALNASLDQDSDAQNEENDAQASKEKDIDMVANNDEILSNDASNEVKAEFVLKSIVKKIENDRLVVEIIESDYAFGVYHILTFDTTKYYNKNGSQITRQGIMVGDTVEITYSGQTMLSYPPQVVAYQIRLAN